MAFNEGLRLLVIPAPAWEYRCFCLHVTENRFCEVEGLPPRRGKPGDFIRYQVAHPSVASVL